MIVEMQILPDDCYLHSTFFSPHFGNAKTIKLVKIHIIVTEKMQHVSSTMNGLDHSLPHGR